MNHSISRRHLNGIMITSTCTDARSVSIELQLVLTAPAVLEVSLQTLGKDWWDTELEVGRIDFREKVSAQPVDRWPSGVLVTFARQSLLDAAVAYGICRFTIPKRLLSGCGYIRVEIRNTESLDPLEDVQLEFSRRALHRERGRVQRCFILMTRQQRNALMQEFTDRNSSSASISEQTTNALTTVFRKLVAGNIDQVLGGMNHEEN